MVDWGWIVKKMGEFLVYVGFVGLFYGVGYSQTGIPAVGALSAALAFLFLLYLELRKQLGKHMSEHRGASKRGKKGALSAIAAAIIFFALLALFIISSNPELMAKIKSFFGL